MAEVPLAASCGKKALCTSCFYIPMKVNDNFLFTFHCKLVHLNYFFYKIEQTNNRKTKERVKKIEVLFSFVCYF